MIEYCGIRKRLGKAEILRDLCLRVEAGQLALLLGANGAGKTTALRIAAGILEEDSGCLLINGKPATMATRRHQVAYLPQGVAFQPRLKVSQLLRFYAAVLQAPRYAVDAALKTWGLEPHADKASAALSGGLRQRLGLAVVTLAKAPVLLLDEPGVSLDAEWRERMQDWLRDVTRQGKTALVATHLLGEWEGRADQCLLFSDGKNVAELDPSKLKDEARRLHQTFEET